MADVVNKRVRSNIMRSVKSCDSQIELNFRKALWRSGIRYRKNVKGCVGHPDVVIKKFKVVVFIDSCFWHGCPKHCRMPSSRQTYWINKIKRNKDRDRSVSRFYQENGWNIFRLWEHDLDKSSKVVEKIKKLLA